MDEIETRLRETTQECLERYQAWRTDENAGTARESLQEAVHELRKVASRLEIEIAISERNEMAQKPIPIPTHRASRRRGASDNGDPESADYEDLPQDNGGPSGNAMSSGSGVPSQGVVRETRRRRGARRPNTNRES